MPRNFFFRGPTAYYTDENGEYEASENVEAESSLEERANGGAIITEVTDDEDNSDLDHSCQASKKKDYVDAISLNDEETQVDEKCQIDCQN